MIWDLRDDFPGLHQTIHGHRLVYLDSAATTQVPQAVIDALTRSLTAGRSNVHRSAHTLGARATDGFEHARRRVARFIGAASPREIVFTGGTTDAINLAASGWGDLHVGPDDEILVTAMEHHSNFVPWQRLCRRRGATLRVVPLDARGDLDLDALTRLLTPKTRLLAITHVSNVVGTLNPIDTIVRAAHAAGALVLVDGAQAVQRLPVDVTALGCDFYAFSGHKVYGPSGIGVLYGRSDVLEAMSPVRTGGGMVRSVTADHTTFAPPPAGLEAGTPHLDAAAGLVAALDYVDDLGRIAIEAHDRSLARYAEAALRSLHGARIVGAPSHRVGCLSFVLDDLHPHDACTALDREGIAIRAGHHCAQPTMAHFGVPATLRASWGIYTTERDIDSLVDALRRTQAFFAAPPVRS